MSKKVALIVAADLQGAIGAANRLPWHLPEDLKRFRSLTMGQPVIMGRKTFQSIGRLLPGRLNLIISRDSTLQISGAEVFHSLQDAVERARIESYSGEGEARVWVIGGGEIYRQSLQDRRVDEVFLTQVKTQVEGADAWFPALSDTEFTCTEEGAWQTSESGALMFRYLKFQRR